MVEAPLAFIWQELRRQNRLGVANPERLGGGNLDRRSELGRIVCRAELADGSNAKLTIGANLDELMIRSRRWSEAFPTFASTPLFHVRIADHDVWAETFFDGITLDGAIRNRAVPFAVVHRAISTIAAEFDQRVRPSTEDARAAEWSAWSTTVVALPHWKPEEKSFLEQQLLPRLGARLQSGPAFAKWIHGDLTGENILINNAGEVRLIDPEFAEETHFYQTELVRFHALSEGTKEQPGLFSAVWPQPEAAWQLHFWLTQIQREALCNTAKYVARWLPDRLSRVRKLGEKLFSDSQLEWPWPATEADEAEPLETAQLFWSNGGSWEETNSVRLSYHPDRDQTLFFPVAGHPQPWRLDPAASVRPTLVKRLSGLDTDHRTLFSARGTELHAVPLRPLSDTVIEHVATGVSVRAPSGDPHFSFRLNESAAVAAQWLQVELAPTTTTEIISAIAQDHFRLEECVWSHAAQSVVLRVTGWCVPHGSELTEVSAHAGDRIVATSAALPRPDVQQHFSGDPRTLHSGFLLEIPMAELPSTLELKATAQDGRRYAICSFGPENLPDRGAVLGDYAAWAKTYDPDPPAPAVVPIAAVRFSILLPVFNTPETFLRECIESVRRQHYPHWELCIVDDASAASWIGPLLDQEGKRDSRIRVHHRAQNGGIADASNDALAMVTGEFIVLLDHDDRLRPHALLELAQQIATNPGVDALYSDEDKITSEGVRLFPFLKPDFSPEFLLGVMYIGHALSVRTTLAKVVGGFDRNFNGIQDYEFFLRCAERTNRIVHVPRILYHWRMLPTSSALVGNVKGDMDRLQVQAVEQHLQRIGRPARVVSHGGHRIRLLPTESAAADCTLIVTDPRYSSTRGALPIMIVTGGGPTQLIEAAREAKTRFVVLVTEGFAQPESDWLKPLLMYAAMDGIGAVGPLLLKPNGKVAAAGCILGPDGAIVPALHDFPAESDGWNGSLACAREVSVLPAACIVIRRDTLLALDGMSDATSLGAWATDLCLGLRAAGKRTVVCPTVRLIAESDDRSFAPLSEQERESLRKRWPSFIGKPDPYYHPHLDHRRGDYRLSPIRTTNPKGAPSVEFHIDTPTTLALSGRYLRMRGWAFVAGASLRHVRLVLPTMELFGLYGTSRPDVRQNFPEAPDNFTGFELWTMLPTGRYRARLEFQDAKGDWHGAAVLDLRVPRRWRPLWLTGSDTRDLVQFQLGARPSHAPIPVRHERFPALLTPPKERPALTIVTPSYNHVRYLAETMQSVLGQIGANVAYVVQDGGSTDGSVELIQQVGSRLASWASTRDNGQADAIARGFALTRGAPGDLMAWINSDDVYLPGTLAYVADYFGRHPEVDVLYGHRILIDENSREVGRWFLPPHDDDLLKLNDFVPQETMFWRRRIWDKVGGIDTSFKFAMDWDLLLRFQAAGAKIVRVPYFLACFRVHAAQKTSAEIKKTGYQEIDALRLRTFGRSPSMSEIENDARLIRFLRKSAWIEFLWRTFHLRHQ